MRSIAWLLVLVSILQGAYAPQPTRRPTQEPTHAPTYTVGHPTPGPSFSTSFSMEPTRKCLFVMSRHNNMSLGRSYWCNLPTPLPSIPAVPYSFTGPTMAPTASRPSTAPTEIPTIIGAASQPTGQPSAQPSGQPTGMPSAACRDGQGFVV